MIDLQIWGSGSRKWRRLSSPDRAGSATFADSRCGLRPGIAGTNAARLPAWTGLTWSGGVMPLRCVLSHCQETRQTPGWRSVADQLMAAATSAAANYRASARARSRAEFVAKIGIVNEESDESVYWLELMADSNIGDRRTVGLLLPEARELRAIFAASYRTARRGRHRGAQ